MTTSPDPRDEDMVCKGRHALSSIFLIENRGVRPQPPAKFVIGKVGTGSGDHASSSALRPMSLHGGEEPLEQFF